METNAKVLGGRLTKSVGVLWSVWVWGLWAISAYVFLYGFVTGRHGSWEGLWELIPLAVVSEVVGRWVRWMFRPA